MASALPGTIGEGLEYTIRRHCRGQSAGRDVLLQYAYDTRDRRIRSQRRHQPILDHRPHPPQNLVTARRLKLSGLSQPVAMIDHLRPKIV